MDALAANSVSRTRLAVFRTLKKESEAGQTVNDRRRVPLSSSDLLPTSQEFRGGLNLHEELPASLSSDESVGKTRIRTGDENSNGSLRSGDSSSVELGAEMEKENNEVRQKL